MSFHLLWGTSPLQMIQSPIRWNHVVLNYISVGIRKPTHVTVWVLLHAARGCNHQSTSQLHAFMFSCSSSWIYDHEIRDEGSGQPWNNDPAWWSSALLRSQRSAFADRNQSLASDHYCLFLNLENVLQNYVWTSCLLVMCKCCITYLLTLCPNWLVYWTFVW